MFEEKKLPTDPTFFSYRYPKQTYFRPYAIVLTAIKIVSVKRSFRNKFLKMSRLLNILSVEPDTRMHLRPPL